MKSTSASLAKLTTNPSGLRPVGRAVLLEPYEPEFHATLIFVPETVREKTMMIENRGLVIELGSECWKTESCPRAKVGDKVMISRYTGAILIGPLNKKVYRMVNDEDIFCVLEVG